LYSREDLASYGEKLFNTPINHSPLENNPCILASDLATVAGTSWLNFSVINGIAELLLRESKHTAALILNKVALVKSDEYTLKITPGPQQNILFFLQTSGKPSQVKFFSANPEIQDVTGPNCT